MTRKDKNDHTVYRTLLGLKYSRTWDCYTDNRYVNEVLSHASKANTGFAGYPDQIYVNDQEKLLILIEDKPSVSQHASSSKPNPEKYAVDGIRHYLKFFLNDNLSSSHSAYFKMWKIVGVAVSGDLNDLYNHRISTFLIQENTIEEKPSISELLDEQSYLNLFSNIDEELIVSKVSKSSQKINKLLRSVDSQKRPILLSALMICLFKTKKETNDFVENYGSWSTKTIVDNLIPTLKKVLKEEKIPQEKVDVIVNELAFISTDQDLSDNAQALIKDILDELNDIVIPLFARKSNYDIIGKFYEEFLRFAGVANVKRGIVLTPRHIATLFTDLVDLKYNDVVIDFACGTGSFLISAMNRIIENIENSQLPDKEALKKNVKSRQLVGFEKNATMYICALSNMMFRGDGKSNINYCDCFSSEATEVLNELKTRGIVPTIGFINPPYGGKDNKENPTKKEIQFLIKMLDSVSRFGVIIAPLSVYFRDDSIRNSILKRHTLKCVINMPHDLFMPNAATDTAIAVFETNKPQGNQKVIFTEIADDGFVLSKSKGRTNAYGKWDAIKEETLDSLSNPSRYDDGKTLLQKEIGDGSEWILQAYAEIDYSRLSSNDFLNAIKRRLVYVAKRDINLLDSDVDEITLIEAITEYYGQPFMRNEPIPVDTSNWQDFQFKQVFNRYNGVRLTKQDMASGSTNFLGAIKGNNGIRDHISEDPVYAGNTISVNYNGSVAEAFYQSEPYWPSDDVYTLDIADELRSLNVYLAMFLITLIRLHKQNFFYGRKWSSGKMENSIIRLPITDEGIPDWDWMESYIKSLPYADLLQ